MKYKQHQFAPNGRPGEKHQKTGANGQDLVIKVPAGTQVFDENQTLLHDLTQNGQRIIIAHGGKGGRGNTHFATPSRRVPDYAQPGQEGEELEILLSLKLLADVSLIGFPNAGKSTLIRNVSRAKPRVADFPFTTLKPHLGVIRVDEDRSYVMADMPGLITGASEGIGLGLRFLKHIERTKIFVFLLTLDYGEERGLLADFLALRHELLQYEASLDQRPYVIAISQMDRLDVQERYQEEKDALAQYGTLYPFSSFSKEGLKDLLDAIARVLNQQGRWVDHDADW